MLELYFSPIYMTLFVLTRLQIPKIWRRALVVAIPKPMKPDKKELSTDISALCPLQGPRQVVYAHVEPIIDLSLSRDQARF